jgi:signal transduction histidine kinase
VSRLRRLLTAPVFDDETKTRQAFMLHVILWALILVPVPYVLITALAAPGATPRAALEGLAGEAINLFLLWLLRRGHVRLAASLQVAAFFAFFVVLAATGLGVRGPAYLVGCGLTIVIAGVLLGGRGALAVTLAAVLAGGVLVARGANDAAGASRYDAPLFVWGVSALLFSVGALVQNLAARTVRQALARARASETRYRSLVGELETKNAELERFTYTVSHDLKSPLITLRGFLGYMESDARAGNLDRLLGDIARVVDATDKMRRLLDELLELSRIGRLVNPPQDVAFADVARVAVELVRGRLDERGVRVEIAAALPVVHGDRARLVEVVQNLVDNSAQFMGAEPHPRVEIGARDGASGPVFFVRDNGVGIPPQHRERVFRLFEKLDPASRGTGVGLALVKRIVELHGGRIWVEPSGPGGGATFCFTLARASAGFSRSTGPPRSGDR